NCSSRCHRSFLQTSSVVARQSSSFNPCAGGYRLTRMERRPGTPRPDGGACSRRPIRAPSRRWSHLSCLGTATCRTQCWRIARLDLWQAQYVRADPVIAGALRLSLEPGLDKKDPDALSRLAGCVENAPSKTAGELIRMLLARADERPTFYGATNQHELLARDRKRIDELNAVAERVNAPRVDLSEEDGVADQQESRSPAGRGSQWINASEILTARIVEGFAEGAVGIGRALRVWRARPYQAQGRKWETDRFVNAIGYRLLEFVDRGLMVDAETVLSMTAGEQTLGDEGGLLAGLGAGLEARGQNRLAAIAFAFAWTRTRGGGGWVNFGGETGLEWLEKAARLNGAAALEIVGAEARRVASGGGLGVCQALVFAFSRIGFGVSPTESTGAVWKETAFACWNEAARVI